MFRQVRALMIAALALAACTKDSRPPSAEVQAPAAAPAPEAGDPADSDEYSVSLAPRADYAVGQPADATIRIAAKSGFHVNPDYPVAFKPSASEGVRFAGERVRLENGQKTPCEAKAEDSCRVDFALPFTTDTAGTAKAAGVLAFSVCSDDKCLIKKVPLTAMLTVK